MARSKEGPLIVLHPEGVEIPTGIRDLESFRAWIHSPGFPERGRIDWVAGRLEVDMSPEELTTHGSLKSAIAGELIDLIQKPEKGLVFIDRTRLTCPVADLSAEPDVLVILSRTLKAGRARFVPKVSGPEGRYIEVEGAADLVVECVSDASTGKDRKCLRDLYHRAGVREYWLVDARGEEIDFQILLHREGGYAQAPADRNGFLRSQVLQKKVRLFRRRRWTGIVFYRLEVSSRS